MKSESGAMRGAGALTACTIAAMAVAGCGGGGGGGEPQPVPVTATVSGSVVKGPLSGATVCAYAIVGGVQSTGLGCTTTDAQGRYSFQVRADGAPVVIESLPHSGEYVDELTGAAVTPNSRLRSAQTLEAGAAATVMITPLTELAIRRALGAPTGLGDPSINDAMTLVARAFDTGDLRRTLPADPTAAGFAGANRGAKNYGLALAGISAMTSGSSLLAVIQDLANKGFRPNLVAGQASAFAAALNRFLASPRNATGLTATTLAAQMQPALAALPQASGVLPAIPSDGSGEIVDPPVQPADGPACVITMTPGPQNLAGQNWRVCVRPVQAEACGASGMASVVAGVQAFSVLASLGPVSTTYEAGPTCNVGDLNETIDR